ncbi:hypothetical protein HN51_028490 [Arachis hypogaea]
MPRSRINGNFIDKTFSIVANILLRIILTTSGEKEAFTYYRDVPTNLMLRKDLLQEGWLEISCKNTSPAQEEPYEMKISRTVLEWRFFELNDDRNGCQRNLKEIMQKLYRIIMRLCDWKLIPMIEALFTQVTENIQKLENIIFGHSNEIRFYPKLLIIWP